MPSRTYITFDLDEFSRLYRHIVTRYAYTCVRHLKDVIQAASLNNDGTWSLQPRMHAQVYQDILRADNMESLQIDGLIPDGGKYTLLIRTGTVWDFRIDHERRALEIIEDLRTVSPQAFDYDFAYLKRSIKP